MLISVENLKKYLKTTENDEVLEAKLKALELLIRKETNNRFQARGFQTYADILDGRIVLREAVPFRPGDTIQITNSGRNDGVYTVTESDGRELTVKEELYAGDAALVTKVQYPMDVVMGAVNMLRWDLENRDKVGIQSESISRHSVTYFNMDGDNSAIGYPKSLTGFLKPYRKARF